MADPVLDVAPTDVELHAGRLVLQPGGAGLTALTEGDSQINEPRCHAERPHLDRLPGILQPGFRHPSFRGE